MCVLMHLKSHVLTLYIFTIQYLIIEMPTSSLFAVCGKEGNTPFLWDILYVKKEREKVKVIS